MRIRLTSFLAIVAFGSLMGSLMGSRLHADLARPQAGKTSAIRSLCEKALIAMKVYHPRRRALSVPTKSQSNRKGHLVIVDHPDSNSPVIFKYTNRHWSDLFEQGLYSNQELNLKSLKNKSVVDLACGEGQVVEDLIRSGIDAVGVDLYLGPYQKSKPYYVQASIDNVSVLPSGAYDVVLSTQGPITYQTKDRAFLLKVFAEARRLLKPGGRFLVSPISIYDLVEWPKELSPNQSLPEWEAELNSRVSALHDRLVQKGAQPLEDLKHTQLLPLPPGWRIRSVPQGAWFLSELKGEGQEAKYWIEFEAI